MVFSFSMYDTLRSHDLRGLRISTPRGKFHCLYEGGTDKADDFATRCFGVWVEAEVCQNIRKHLYVIFRLLCPRLVDPIAPPTRDAKDRPRQAAMDGPRPPDAAATSRKSGNGATTVTPFQTTRRRIVSVRAPRRFLIDRPSEAVELRLAGARVATVLACACAAACVSFNIMVESFDTTFAALAHPTRRGILARLARGETSIGAIADACDNISLNAVSKHVMALEDAGLVSRRVEWRTHYLSINPEPLRAAAEWLEHYRVFWEHRLDALERFLAQKKGARHGPRNPPDAKNRRKPRRGV